MNLPINTNANYFVLSFPPNRKRQNLQSLQNQKKIRSPEKEKEKVQRNETLSFTVDSYFLLALLSSLSWS